MCPGKGQGKETEAFLLLLLFSGVLIGLGFLLLRWMYAFHYFTLEGCGFKQARKRGAVLAVFLGGVFSRLKLVGIVSASVVWIYLAVSLLVLSAFGTPVSYACISILFYGHKEDRQEKIIYGGADRYQEKLYIAKPSRL